MSAKEKGFPTGRHLRRFGSKRLTLFQSGESEYRILRPKNALPKEILATDELNRFWEKATGFSLEIVYDESVQPDAEEKFISVGETKLAKKYLDIRSQELGTSGYRISAVGNSILLCGGSEEGTLFSVYDWLEILFGFRTYADDEIAIRKSDSLIVDAPDVTEIPDFAYREAGFGNVVRDPLLRARFRMNEANEFYTFGHDTHNSFLVLPPKKYLQSHPEWYHLNPEGEPAQLCYSAPGIAEAYAENLLPRLTDETKITLLGMEDNWLWCDCPACREARARYGTDSAVVIRFMNRVVALVEQKRRERDPCAKPLQYLMFAYYATNDAPVRRGAKGWEPIDDSVRLADNIGIMYAPGGADFTKPLYAPENAHYYEQIEKWRAITDILHLWVYTLYAFQYTAPYPFEFAMSENYRLYRSCGSRALLDQVRHEQCRQTAFDALHSFLISRLSWNVEENVEDLIQEFFPAYYGKAAVEVRKAFDKTREILRNAYKMGAKGSWGDNIVKCEYWKEEALEDLLAIFRRADAVLDGEENPMRRRKCKNRIAVEMLPYRLMLLELYGEKFTEASLHDGRMRFREDFCRLGVQRVNEIEKIEELWTRWKLSPEGEGSK